MKNLIFTLLAPAILLSCASTRTIQSGDGAVLTMPELPMVQFEMKKFVAKIDAYQRVGLFLESSHVEFKGCVMYLEGFGDSIQNHYPMFNSLRNAGYRVISFDYLGQGGSEGSMNQTRILAADIPGVNQLPYTDVRDQEISEQAKKLWQYYSDNKDGVYNRSCAQSPKRVIGWSTGGLAAYKLANEKWATAYVLINPALAPRLCVGETVNACQNNIGADQIVTLRTLTRATPDAYHDPHLDPVRPTTPRSALLFSGDLIASAALAGGWKIDKSQKMLVFLSGMFDAYNDPDATTGVLVKHVPSYRLFPYPLAFHELDNELPDVTDDMYPRLVDFLNAH